MATSLQQQLAALAAKSTHQLDLKAQKGRHSKSLLFEPRDAANQSIDTIFQICHEGFTELCQLDNRFLPFGRNLFSDQSKSEYRAQMTAQENEELDRVIVIFLGLLGSRLLLKPGMKVLEWLVRKFEVHEYNTEALLITFLPHHDTQAFPAVLAILPEQLPSNFRFLHPYIATFQNPPQHAIVLAAVNNPTFLIAFSQYVMNVAKARHHSVSLLNFWAKITSQAVYGMIEQNKSGREAIRKRKEEDILLKVLPIVQSALLIPDIPDLYAAACLIISILISRLQPAEKVTDASMKAVAKGWSKQTFEPGLACIAILAEEKQSFRLPKYVTSAIVRHENPMATLKRVASYERSDRLLTGLSLALIDRTTSISEVEASQLLLAIPHIKDLPESHVGFVLENAMSRLSSQTAEEQQTPASEAIRTFLQIYLGQSVYTAAIKDAAEKTNYQSSRLIHPNSRDSHEASKTHIEEDETDAMEIDIRPDSLTHLAALPVMSSEGHSFLNPEKESEFQSFANAFRLCFEDDSSLASLIDKESLKKASPLEAPNLLTFLAHIWTSDVSTTERQKALNIARQSLAHDEDSTPKDMQAIVPYVIHALSDSSKVVRAEARAFCISLGSINRSGKKDNDPKADVTWAKNMLYGTRSSQVRWLSPNDSDLLLRQLLIPMLENCVLDPDFAIKAIANSLNASAGTIDKDRQPLKLASRIALCENLVSHALLTPATSVKLRLLDLSGRLGKVGNSARTSLIVPHIQNSSSALEQPVDKELSRKIARALVDCLSHRSVEEVQLLKLLASGSVNQGGEMVSIAFSRIAQLFKMMKGAAQTELYDWLMGLVLDDQLADQIHTAAVDTVGDMSLPTAVLVHAVETLPNVVELQDQPTPAKKQRTSRDSDTPRASSAQKAKLTSALKRITLVLELVESSKPEKHPLLLKGLFTLLGNMRQYKTIAGSDLIYLHGLLIGNLQAVIDGLKLSDAKDVDRSVIRADWIVECVRTTSNTQVHNAALLLMSSLASWAPEHVLHGVMPLFTFMSTTILKQGDDYSAHVTEKAITCIIPPMIASLKRNGKDLVRGAAGLLLSFVTAFGHIPLNRRSGIFENLVQTLGAGESLFAVVAMLVSRYQPNPTAMTFITNLMSKFPVDLQFQAVGQYLDLVFDTLKPKRGLSDVILGYEDKSGTDAKLSTIGLQNGLATAVISDSLRRQLVKELNKDEATAETLRVAYSELLEKAMQLTLFARDDVLLQPGAEKILSTLLRLMPTKDFIDASAKLMQTGTHDVRQLVFASLENRVSTAKRGDAALQEVFIGVIPSCCVFIAKSQPAATRHAAIACIDQIAEKYGKTDPSAIVEAAEVVAGDDALGSEDRSLRTISLLCLATMVEVVEDEFLPILPSALQKAIDSLNELATQEVPNLPLYKASLSLASAILDHLPWALSTHFVDQFLQLAASFAKRMPEMADVSGKFCMLAATKLPAQECFGAIDRTWTHAVQQGSEAIRQHIQLLQAAIKFHSKSTITKSSSVLFSVLQAAFNLRVLLSETQATDKQELQGLYSLVDEVALDAVMKLNDATFRPFFIRLIEWATDDTSEKASTLRYLRCTSLFSFTYALFEQLKSLVTSYVGFLLDSATTLLRDQSQSDEVKRPLLNLIVQSLASNFRHDQDDFWQAPSHFDAVAEPLLAQLKYADTVTAEECLIPAITDLAVAASSPEHHKSMNGILMTYMRHQDNAVRLAAVRCERDITTRLNLDWLTLLPEMLPFISELQEDDDESVERETLRWVKQIEEVTGESLEGMLS